MHIAELEVRIVNSLAVLVMAQCFSTESCAAGTMPHKSQLISCIIHLHSRTQTSSSSHSSQTLVARTHRKKTRVRWAGRIVDAVESLGVRPAVESPDERIASARVEYLQVKSGKRGTRRKETLRSNGVASVHTRPCDKSARIVHIMNMVCGTLMLYDFNEHGNQSLYTRHSRGAYIVVPVAVAHVSARCPHALSDRKHFVGATEFKIHL